MRWNVKMLDKYISDQQNCETPINSNYCNLWNHVETVKKHLCTHVLTPTPQMWNTDTLNI